MYTAASKQIVLRRGATGRRRVSYLGKTKVLCITNICGTAMYVVLLGILGGDSGCVWLETWSNGYERILERRERGSVWCRRCVEDTSGGAGALLLWTQFTTYETTSDRTCLFQSYSYVRCISQVSWAPRPALFAPVGLGVTLFYKVTATGNMHHPFYRRPRSFLCSILLESQVRRMCPPRRSLV